MGAMPASVYVHTNMTGAHQSQKRTSDSLNVIDGCEWPRGCWKSNLGPGLSREQSPIGSCLNSWLPVGGCLEGLGVALLEEICHNGQALRVQKTHIILS